MPNMSPTELAWLAGFIDADGHIGIRRPGTGYFVLQLVVGGTHRPSIERCRDLMTAGGPYADKRRPPRKPAWRTTLSGSKAKAVLTHIYPYMVTKRRQAAIALTFPIGNGLRGKPAPPLQLILQDECCKAIGKLNKKGC